MQETSTPLGERERPEDSGLERIGWGGGGGGGGEAKEGGVAMLRSVAFT